MVLIRRSTVVGFILAFVLSTVLLGGCSESLFGAHRGGQGSGGDDGGGDDGGVNGVSGCADPCNADAATDFDGTVHGAHDRWRYLDDHRDRTWATMTVGGQVMSGADPRTHITTCAAHPEAPACGPLPGALLISNGASDADPAIELTVAAAQVIDLELKAFVPTGQGTQTIRLYRNSREDVLFTGTATAGTALDQVITLDALPGDRFLVAVAPVASGATDVGLQLTTRANGATFPSSCKLALPFTTATGNTTPDPCGGPTFNYFAAMGNTSKPPMLVAGPFPEQGKAATILAGEYFQRGMDDRQTFQWPQEFTVQFWFRVNPIVGNQFNNIFSDWDSQSCGGVGIDLSPAAPELAVHMCQFWTATTYAEADLVYRTFDLEAGWQFLRVVRTSTSGYMCLNGSRVQTASVMSQSYTGHLLSLGRENSLPTTGAYFDGLIDDVRVISGALPCE